VASIEILRGYSASGKSTYARQSGKFIVSRDLIRQQFGATGKTVFGQETEAKVSKIQEAAAKIGIPFEPAYFLVVSYG
jgi:predicted kinase